MSINQANRALLACLALALMLLAPQHHTAAQGDDKAAKKKEDAPKHKDQYAQEFEHSFKSDKELNPLFHWHGDEPQGCMEFDATGLLIHLPDGHPGKRMGTGVGINTPVKGDFEITLRYDMIKEPAPADAGEGTGIFLWVDVTKNGLNRGYLSRVTKSAKQYGVWSHLTREEGQKPVDVTRTFPTNDSSGRMRIVRTGATLYYYASAGANGQFTLLYRHLFPTEEVQSVRWGGTTGGPKASLDARFIDLKIRADDLPDLPKNRVAAADKHEEAHDAAAAPRKNFVWLIAALVIGLVLVVTAALVGGLMLFLRRKA